MLLAHPEAEDLGRFVEGTLENSEHAAIVQHIADCDDCRLLVVDAAEFIEPEQVESGGHRWWMGIAAAVLLVAVIGPVSYQRLHDPLSTAKKDSGGLSDGPLAVRLAGFRYAPHHLMRGDGDEPDSRLYMMKGDAAALMELNGTDAKTVHARGIGVLLADDPKKSIPDLQAAADREPGNANYQSDLAAALITAARNDRPMLEQALAASDRALRIDPRSPDALFNRAVALQALDNPEAVAAYDRYLVIDSTSPWADEARRHIELLRPLP
jgi:tetratricopeptide (TPR) repeat protein